MVALVLEIYTPRSHKMRAVVRTSEFWMVVAGALGSVLAALGLVSVETWNTLIVPTIVYVVGRIVSKAAKAAIPSK